MNSSSSCSIVICLALLGVLAPASAQVCSKKSPAHTVALLELYTSEGCSSCPPADRFLSSLAAGARDDTVVPLSLHVDYWDGIGWKDPFAKPLFTQRQRWLSGLAASRTIYTPEVFVAGRELRNWRSDADTSLRRINAQPARATIEISLGKIVEHHLPVALKAQSSQQGGLFLYIALTENMLASDVGSGENKGVRLLHDRVVREWVGPIPLTGGSAAVTQSLTVPLPGRSSQLGVTAFVQSDQGDVLQALALPVCS